MIPFKPPPDDCPVFALDRSLRKLFCKLRVCRIVLCNHHQTGSILIEAMNDPGTHGIIQR